MIFDLQKASLLKRFSAFLLDLIVIAIAVTGFSALFSMLFGYDAHEQALQDVYARYEAEYGVSFDLTNEEFLALPESQQEIYNKAYEALNADTEAVYTYNMVIQLTLTISTISILASFLIFEFAVPLWLKNGQTIGKKIFSIAVMREDGVRISTFQLFVRSILGKFTIETMIPFLTLFLVFFGSLGLTGTVIASLIACVQVVLLFKGKRCVIHDLLARTVAVDMASQMIFDTADDLIEYKKRISAEKAANQTY